MAEIKNVFISHVHEDDKILPQLKDLIKKNGMECRDSSITSEKPNRAKSPEYIKQNILAPNIKWASTLVVLITPKTKNSEWVNWEIESAVKQGKTVIGVYAHGEKGCELPDALKKYGDAAIVGWQGDRVIDAINGTIKDWDDPTTEKPRDPEWLIDRHNC